MAHNKTAQLENLKKLGADTNKINSALAGLNACFQGEDIIDKIGSRLGQIKGDVQEALPDHPSVKKLEELHKSIQSLHKMCMASGELLELIQDPAIDLNNPGSIKTDSRFVKLSKTFGKIPAEGLADFEAVIGEVKKLLGTGLPALQQLPPRTNKQVQANLKFFNEDADLNELARNIGGSGTLEPAYLVLYRAVETVRTPSSPRVNPAGSNPNKKTGI